MPLESCRSSWGLQDFGSFRQVPKRKYGWLYLLPYGRLQEGSVLRLGTDLDVVEHAPVEVVPAQGSGEGEGSGQC